VIVLVTHELVPATGSVDVETFFPPVTTHNDADGQAMPPGEKIPAEPADQLDGFVGSIEVSTVPLVCTTAQKLTDGQDTPAIGESSVGVVMSHVPPSGLVDTRIFPL
jgi:hypothetical protein